MPGFRPDTPPADAGRRLAEMQVRLEPDLTHDCLQNRLLAPDFPPFQVQERRHLYFCSWWQSLYTGITSIPVLDGFSVVGLAWEFGADREGVAGGRLHTFAATTPSPLMTPQPVRAG